MSQNIKWEKDGYIIRPALESDAENYYIQNYDPLDKEVARLTGCKETFTKEEVVSFFLKSLNDDDRYFFLIIAPDGRIIGENVINEIDWKLRCANFRIGIFHAEERGKGIGTWAIESARDFAFEELKLHRLELDVYSFNPHAEKAYLKVGFRREGILRDVVLDRGNYADDILMSILEDEWRTLKENQHNSGGCTCRTRAN
ncbi:MAG: GNAT family N-acetyltransferase [Lachnospiraceae bacterium]